VLDKIPNAKTPPQLWRLMRTYYRSMGFLAFAYVIPRRTGELGTTELQHVQGGFDPRLFEFFVSNKRASKFDAMTRTALTDGRIIRLSSIWDWVKPDTMTAAYMSELRQSQEGDGYIFPVFGPHGRNGAVSVGRSINDAVMDEAPLNIMHAVAQAAHMRACALMKEKPALNKPLSGRERDVLNWVARGKSNAEIAIILGISAGTVETYMRNIFLKLDVIDRTSAALRGLRMGIVTEQL
jgi:DNA-binding CsgD family transcriptional regulator